LSHPGKTPSSRSAQLLSAHLSPSGWPGSSSSSDAVMLHHHHGLRPLLVTKHGRQACSGQVTMPHVNTKTVAADCCVN
jgi:hypothetical protein